MKPDAPGHNGPPLTYKDAGVDIDAGFAEAKLSALKARLESLDRDDVSIDVRTNALAALAELQALKPADTESPLVVQIIT